MGLLAESGYVCNSTHQVVGPSLEMTQHEVGCIQDIATLRVAPTSLGIEHPVWPVQVHSHACLSSSGRAWIALCNLPGKGPWINQGIVVTNR